MAGIVKSKESEELRIFWLKKEEKIIITVLKERE